MKESNEGLKRGFALRAEGYWKSWYGDAEARAASRLLEMADRDTAIEILSALFTRICIWGLEALRMECPRCVPASAVVVSIWRAGPHADLTLVEICDACFRGTMSGNEARVAVIGLVDGHPRSEIVEAVEALLIRVKALGREALRRRCCAYRG
ncbi:hypothetical protein AQ960_02975 [Burkholderia pseudomallei]|uniref:hypothetical protein n=1 Tax=Burkholderia pseudomallei TaxID=28450 RepID=UPI000975F69E|nr:hypothetical protein [Burkholderia pseudomallei]MBF4044456.1 hypothetical protein [Burkholderia pseudomallei]ONF01714.1 hypothetical protein AQ960_02975 [Burkholderia pseudomallei]